jgi:hypothetical protein
MFGRPEVLQPRGDLDLCRRQELLLTHSREPTGVLTDYHTSYDLEVQTMPAQPASLGQFCVPSAS